MASAQQSFDPGLTQQFGGRLRRAINKDGTFNVVRKGTKLGDVNLYLYLVRIPWTAFVAWVFGAYLVANVLFATAYYAIGVNKLQGADVSTPEQAFLSAFFFSTHTLTTVGYGSISPVGTLTNSVAGLEALTGLMIIAVATGVLYARVARPSARIRFSESILIAPYQDKTSLQFRVVNKRSNSLMELEAKLLLMTVDETAAGLKRDYKELKLERSGIYFFPLTWTVVHPIDQDSPLYGLTAADLERKQTEFLIMIKGFDETFSQVVHSRYSYRYDEVQWGAKFAPAFEINPQGDIVLETDRVGELLSERS